LSEFEKLRALALRADDDPLAPVLVDYRAEIIWVDGIPTLANAPVRLSAAPKSSMEALLMKVLDLPYDGKDPALQGLTNGEATMVNLARDAAAGMPSAREIVLDRVMGKPQQNIKSESVNLTGDLNEFLDKVAEKTRVQTVDVPAEVSPITDVEDL